MCQCASALVCGLMALFTLKSVEGYFGQRYRKCYYTEDLVTIEFIYSWYFNKVEFMRYNSTTDRFTGFTAFGARQAEKLNLDPKNSLYSLVYTFCKDSSDKYSTNVLKKVKPEVVLKSLRSKPPIHSLVCSVYDYFPKGIRVSWLKDGKLLTEGLSSTEELSNGDWYYQIHSYLDYTPRPGENISCMVEHASFSRPFIQTWDDHLPEDQRNKLIIGIFLLVLGILLAVTGFLFYMLRSKVYMHKQTSQTISLGSSSVSISNASEASVDASSL